MLPVIPALRGGARPTGATLAVAGRLHGQGEVLVEADWENCHCLGTEVTASDAQLSCEAHRIS